MLNTVTITKGTRFGKPFSGTYQTYECTLKIQPGQDSKGNKKIYCPIFLDNKKVWIKIEEEKDVQFITAESNEVKMINKEIEMAIPIETEEQALNRMKTRFDIMQRLVRGVCAGAIRSLVVSGPAGVGKSYGVELELERQALLGGFKYEVIKGAATPIFLYQKMYEFADSKSILVFDDCDSVFHCPVSLNILKAALDSTKSRRITWGSESRILRDKNIPNVFEFQGAVIFITNLKFDKIRSDTLRDHLAAVESRSHYLDLTINTPRDKVLRIKQIVRDSSILDEYGFTPDVSNKLVNYIEEHSETLREVSLRMLKKLADLAMYTEDWESIANTTCKKF